MPSTTVFSFDLQVLQGLERKQGSKQLTRSFVSLAISRYPALDAGRAQMTVKTWYSEELAEVQRVSLFL
jgi:hypothetical protein